MNKLLLVLALVAPLTYAEDLSPKKDKLMHFGFSTAISGAATIVSEDWRVGFGVCMGVGLAKEIHDEISYGGFSGADLAYDAAGCALGAFVGDYAVKLHKQNDVVMVSYTIDF